MQSILKFRGLRKTLVHNKFRYFSLSAEELQFYHEEGYVVPTYRLSRSFLMDLQNELNWVVDVNNHLRPEFLFQPHLRENSEGGVTTRGSPLFLQLACKKPIVDIVSQIIGSNIILWGTHIWSKPAFSGKSIPMHQDGINLPMSPLNTCTVWVCLEDSTKENGCLRVIPKSHIPQRTYEQEPYSDPGSIMRVKVKHGEPYTEESDVSIELKAGQMSLHDIYLLHASDKNSSPNRRTGISLRYMDAACVFRREETKQSKVNFEKRPLFLLRGENTGGNTLVQDFRNKVR